MAENKYSNKLYFNSQHNTLNHTLFGDLSRHKAVNLNDTKPSCLDFVESSPTYYHLSVTGNCYARCEGCINSYSHQNNSLISKDNATRISDAVSKRDARCILNLIRQNGAGEATICFYGGEPLLRTDLINDVYEIIESGTPGTMTKYMLYTNGELLDKAIQKYPKLMSAIWLYNVSIDGTEKQHNNTRAGTSLENVHQSLKSLKKIRKGHVLMWSTLREDQSLFDCFEEFIFLHENGLADKFYWHWVETAEPFSDLMEYAQRYEGDLNIIMEEYVSRLFSGDILPIVHINELIIFMLAGKKRNSSACGVELAGNYDIIDGRIHSCADLPIEMAIGSIDDEGNPHLFNTDLSSLVAYKKDLSCYTCGVHDYCGGRCPVQAQISDTERMTQYCQLMRLHVGIVKQYTDEIRILLMKHNISLQDIYNKSAHFAQFTDVTP